MISDATYKVDLTYEQLSLILLSGAMSPDELAELIDGAETVENCLVLTPRVWHADDGNADMTYENVRNGREAAELYVDGGDWGEITETTWISVHTWREGINECGLDVRVNEGTYKIALEPEEPECTEGEHEWCSDYDLVGGCRQNPGVFGHGGGVYIHEACRKCGCGRMIDTWAQDRYDGEQGLRSVSYREHEYNVCHDEE